MGTINFYFYSKKKVWLLHKNFRVIERLEFAFILKRAVALAASFNIKNYRLFAFFNSHKVHNCLAVTALNYVVSVQLLTA